MRLIAALALAAAFSLSAGPAAAQEYPVREDDLVVDDTSGSDGVVVVGERVRISGGGFVPGSTVTLVIESDPIVLGTTVADGAGFIDVSVTIPSGLTAGGHTLKASGPAPGGGTLVLSQPVTVAASQGSDPGSAGQGSGSRLPVTGGALILSLTVVGAGAIGAGTAAVRIARSRRSS